jgi:cytochrome b
MHAAVERSAPARLSVVNLGTVRVRVWDVPTRIFHWLLLVLVAASAITGAFDSILGAGALEWHRRSGLAILGLLVFRILWGFVGGTHARFANFLRGPRAVVRYAKDLSSGGELPESAGHNPLGGWSVAAMLCALALQVGTGLFLVQEDYAFVGPLAHLVSRATSDRLNGIHHANLYVIAALGVAHVAAVVFYTVVKRQDLVGAMFTGRKRLAAGREGEESRGGGPVMAAAAMFAAAAAIAVLANLA